jgi:hypothetical protein
MKILNLMSQLHDYFFSSLGLVAQKREYILSSAADCIANNVVTRQYAVTSSYAFNKMIELSLLVNEYTSVIVQLDDLSFDVSLNDFEGQL